MVVCGLLASGFLRATLAAPGPRYVRWELREYHVVVVEGLGYGYSYMTPVSRTVENIKAELHQALSKLNIDRPYILAGHSMAGSYTLFYANHYREEVSAVVGINPTVPAAGAGPTDALETAAGINWGRMLSTTGVVRWSPRLCSTGRIELLRTRARSKGALPSLDAVPGHGRRNQRLP